MQGRAARDFTGFVGCLGWESVGWVQDIHPWWPHPTQAAGCEVLCFPPTYPIPKLRPSLPPLLPHQASAQKITIFGVGHFEICFSDFAFCFCSVSGSPGDSVGPCCSSLKPVNLRKLNFTFYRCLTLGLGASRNKKSLSLPKCQLLTMFKEWAKLRTGASRVFFVENTKFLISIHFFKQEGYTPPPRSPFTSHPALSIFTVNFY